MIEAQDLSRRYGDFVAVDHASFRIDSGEVVGLLGHNGAGKTTIMKMLTGFIEPSSGTALVDGVSVQEQPLLAQAKMGYLPENSPLYPELTVIDYLAYAAQLRGLDPHSCVTAAIEATQLQEKALERIDTLSRGFKQRVGVAQAILHQPQILILDEPTNGLDPNQIQQMRTLIKDLSAHATVILSTHILQEVEAVCDRAIILRAGQIVVDEKLDALQRTTSMQLVTDPGSDVLAPLSGASGVTAVKDNGSGRWQIEFEGDVQNTCAATARSLVNAGINIYELSPVTQDLESIFRELNEVASAENQHAA